MVAARDTSSSRARATPFATAPDEAVRRVGFGPVRFTVADTLAMIERGILREDATVELLDGELVYRDRFDLRGDQIVEGAQHNYVVAALGELKARIDTAGRHLRTQSTLVCSESHAPILDGMVLRGTLADYRERLPTAADAWCVVEVADASYERDAGEKLRGYAEAGVQQYVIVNLRDRTAEVYTSPNPSDRTYPPPTVVTVDQALALRTGDGETFTFPLADVLP